jgi:DNA-binding IclR family transcriptional regulator
VATVLKPRFGRISRQRAELLKLRSSYLVHNQIFGPAWAILLRIVGALAANKTVEACGLASEQNVSAGTARRCLEYLVERGFVKLGPGLGKRFRTVELTPLILMELGGLFDSVDDADELEKSTLALLADLARH